MFTSRRMYMQGFGIWLKNWKFCEFYEAAELEAAEANVNLVHVWFVCLMWVLHFCAWERFPVSVNLDLPYDVPHDSGLFAVCLFVESTAGVLFLDISDVNA